MTKALLFLAVLAVFASPSIASAQGGSQAAHVDARLSDLQRSLAALSTQLAQLKAQNQQLEKQLEKMQTDFGQRLERLEKGPVAKPVPKRSGNPK